MRMNKMTFGMFAMASMLFATSCSQDELQEVANGKYVTATFNLTTPEGINTRAIGDGTTVNKIVCATYDANGTEMQSLRQYLDIQGKKATYSIRLVKGQNYRIAFFAYYDDEDNDNQPEYYNIEDLKNIKILEANSNIEERDAFTAFTDIEEGQTMQPIEREITLYRPFAQLNMGSYNDDWKAAIAAGVTVTMTQVKVSNVYTAFSAYEDAVVGETSEVTFEMNALPANGQEWLYADVDQNGQSESYNYLALNYLLVGDKQNEKNLTDIEFVWKTNDEKTNNPTTEFKNVPVQRNYRTNILGWLLTNPAVFNITIDAEFEKPDYNLVAVDGTQTAEGLAKNGTNEFIDNGTREVAIIENMHITADETAIVVNDINAPSGTLLVQNSTINAKLFMELNEYYTIIVRNCHLNVEELIKITTGKTAYQIIFSNCYLNGEPMVSEKKSEYFGENFLSLNTVNINFSDNNDIIIPDNGGNNGDNNQGGDNGDDNQGGNVLSETNMSEVMDEIGEVYNNQFYYVHDKEFGVVNIDAKAYGDLYYFENVTFNDYIYIEESQTLIFDNCTFSKKGLVVNKTGDLTVQVQVKNCKLSNGDAISRSDVKGSGW